MHEASACSEWGEVSDRRVRLCGAHPRGETSRLCSRRVQLLRGAGRKHPWHIGMCFAVPYGFWVLHRALPPEVHKEGTSFKGLEGETLRGVPIPRMDCRGACSDGGIFVSRSRLQAWPASHDPRGRSIRLCSVTSDDR